jgi:hypothetical protein
MSSRKSAKSSKSSNASNASRASKSSKRDSKSDLDTLDSKVDFDTRAPTRSRAILSLAFALLFQGLIIYYLYNLEGADCNCIRDWRHNYIKYFAIFLIGFAGICVIMPSLSTNMVVIALTMILSIVNLYAFFTYIGDLNTTQCSCAIHKQPNLNSFMHFIRWVQVILMIIGVASLIYFFFALRNISKAT